MLRSLIALLVLSASPMAMGAATAPTAPLKRDPDKIMLGLFVSDLVAKGGAGKTFDRDVLRRMSELRSSPEPEKNLAKDSDPATHPSGKIFNFTKDDYLAMGIFAQEQLENGLKGSELVEVVRKEMENREKIHEAQEDKDKDKDKK